MTTFRMCDGKVRFRSVADAMAEAHLQQSQRPHYLWSYYDCLWCDFLHIGRAGTAAGHTTACHRSCQRRVVHERELRLLEGSW